MSNFHVNYLTGSDVTGDGTTGLPWATIAHALITGPAIAGDVVKVVGSTTTDVDVAAGPNTNNLTTVLQTSVDLTGQLAANDIIRVSPNMSDGPEFDGWMLTEIVSITATSITTRAEWQLPNQATTNFTITKINDQVFKTTTETIAPTYPDVTVECGYDATFTSIVGLTFFVNNSTGAGGRSGNGPFSITSSTFQLLAPFFKNLAVCKWTYGIQTGFANGAQVQNLHLLNTNANLNGGMSYMCPTTEAILNVYYNDCDGNLPYSVNNAYYEHQTGFDAFKAPLKPFINQSMGISILWD